MDWTIDGSGLSLRDSEGNAVCLSTDDIYRSLVEKKPAADWIPTSVDGLRPSRYPLVPILTISEGSDDKAPSYGITSVSRGVEVPLDLADLERGHKVAEGVWYPIEPAASAEIRELMRSNDVALGEATSLKAFLAIRKAAKGGASIEDRTAERAISPLAFAPSGDDTPAGVQATLYPYQISGWRWLKFLLAEGVGGLLADEMGLGKTLQIISALSDSGGAPLRPALIIAPGSLLENWRREISKFAPHLKVLKHHGALRTGRPSELNDYDVVVTSYDNAVRDNSLLNMIL